MAVLIERRASTAAKWSRRFAIFAAVLLLTSILGHRIGAVDEISLFWLFGIVVTLALVAILLAVAGFFRLWEFGDRGGRNSTAGLLIALVVLAPFALAAFRVMTLPSLTDLSTDTVDAPTFFHAVRQRDPRMNPLGAYDRGQAQLQIDRYPEVTGRRYALGPEAMMSLIRAVLDQLGWTSLGPVRVGGFGGVQTLEVAAPSPWVGLTSDIAIRMTDEGETIYVDVRSASRYGLHDLGDNAAKINRFFETLEAEIQARNALFPQPAE